MKVMYLVFLTTVAGVANVEVEKLWTTLISKYNPFFPTLIWLALCVDPWFYGQTTVELN